MNLLKRFRAQAVLSLLTISMVGCAFASSTKTAESEPKVTPNPAAAEITHLPKKDEHYESSQEEINTLIDKLIARVEERNFNWDVTIFARTGWQSRGKTVNGLPLIYWTCGEQKNENASLILSAVHGDEVTPVYFGFRLVEYLKARPELCEDRFVVVAPIVNPDGFLRYRTGTRSNYHKVDLNRNFDTPDWDKFALSLWRTKYNKRRRYFPGDKPNSEPETRFQKWLISEFRPVKIMSVHAPLNILDYDGPRTEDTKRLTENYFKSVEKLREAVKTATPTLRYYAYGNFPGSLGNYAGKQRGIPTITAELPSTDPTKAALYFGLIEEGTRTFITQEITDSPMRNSQHQRRFSGKETQENISNN